MNTKRFSTFIKKLATVAVMSCMTAFIATPTTFAADNIFASAYLKQVQPVEQDTTSNNFNTRVANDTTNTNNAIISNTESIDLSGDLKNFPSRNVVIVNPSSNTRKDRAEMAQFMRTAITNELKYPYYSAVTTNRPTSASLATANSLATIAEETGADIVLLPIAVENDYVQYRPTRTFRFDSTGDEIYTRVAISAKLYYYDANKQEFKGLDKTYYKDAEYLSVPTQREIWNKVMTDLMNKLPYKRVPTDINRYTTQTKIDTSSTATAQNFNQVEQPISTTYSLAGVSEL